jgi:hypothetical protein
MNYYNLRNRSTEYTGGLSSDQQILMPPGLFSADQKMPYFKQFSFGVNKKTKQKIEQEPISVLDDRITNIINILKLNLSKEYIEEIKESLENLEKDVVKLKNIKLDMILKLNNQKIVDLFKNCSIEEIKELLSMNTSICFNTSYSNNERIKQYIILNVELNPLIILFLSENIINEIENIKEIAEKSAIEKNIVNKYNLLCK